MDVVSRKQAKLTGLTRYFTGAPCPYGHFAERFVSSCNCVSCAKGVLKRWLSKNPQKKRALDNKWWNENSARRAPQQRIRKRLERLNNPQGAITAVRRWQKSNPEKVRAMVRNRDARRKRALGSHTADEILALLERQNWKCAACNISIRKRRHIDHVIPLSRGGSNDIANLQGLCPACNCSKNAKDPIVWAQENGRLL